MQCTKPILVRHTNRELCDPAVRVPCGKCIDCLQNKRAEWTFRLMQELKICDSANFVTLTYNDKYRPGELVKKDVQLFIKRVRAHVAPIKIRYFFVGEYGPETGREHYHGIIYNLPDELEVLDKWTKDGESMGFVHVGTVTQASIHYVTKYMLKNLKSRPYGKTIPFAIMSKKPGLGTNYVTDYKDYHANRTDSFATLPGGIKQRLPRHIKDKIFTEE